MPQHNPWKPNTIAFDALTRDDGPTTAPASDAEAERRLRDATHRARRRRLNNLVFLLVIALIVVAIASGAVEAFLVAVAPRDPNVITVQGGSIVP